MRSRSAAVCLILVAASSLGLRKVRAQLSDVQPFTAIETYVTRGADLKVPIAHVDVLAVSGDGQLTAWLWESLLPGRRVYHRSVWNKREKTIIRIDPELKMLTVDLYYEPVYVNGADWYVEDGHATAGSNCQGTPDGQIEGFDVYRTEHLVGENPSNPGETTTEKRWAAPKLGCYVLRDEELTKDKDGKFVGLILRALSNIVIGEPDPSYFDTSLPKGYSQVLTDDWKDAYVNRMKAVRAIREQPPR
jgi:hypothetical protein